MSANFVHPQPTSKPRTSINNDDESNDDINSNTNNNNNKSSVRRWLSIKDIARRRKSVRPKTTPADVMKDVDKRRESLTRHKSLGITIKSGKTVKVHFK